MQNVVMPLSIIRPYFRVSGYVYLHVPTRFATQCNVNPGVTFALFVKDGKIVIEQQKVEAMEESHA